MHKFVVRAEDDGPRAYTIHMPGGRATREVDILFEQFTKWSNTCAHEDWHADFPRFYITYSEADEAFLLENFGDIVANTFEEYRNQQ